MIDLINLAKNKKSFRFRLIISYILFTLFIIASITVVHIHLSKLQNDTAFENDVRTDAMQKIDFLHQYLEQKESEAKAMAHSPLVLSAIEATDYAYVSRYFLDMAKANPDYMQIRYIHQSGWEIVRVDRTEQRQKPFLVVPKMLQNKADRYYFLETMNTGRYGVWFSPMDLNEEYGKVEQPIKPVLRVGVPIYKNDAFDGIFIVNLFIKDFMTQLFSGQAYDNYLVDEQGYYLIHENTQKQWSRYFKQCTLKHDFPEQYQSILHTQEPLYFRDTHIFAAPFFIGNYRYTMIFTPKKALLEQKKENEAKMVYPILAIVILGAIVFAYILSKPFDRANQLLANEAQKLHEATINLENRVKQEVEKNERQDRILQHQSKLSALGELLSAITHQWRHPITRISLLLQNLRRNLSDVQHLDLKSDTMITASLGQIDFLSETIENFKNFYKPDEDKEAFRVEDALSSVLSITQDLLEHHGIGIKIELTNPVEIFGSKIALAHVFLNIINNAKDEMIQRKIKEPKITISMRQRKTHLSLFIYDNAGGAKPELLQKIFEPYVSTKNKDGSGIGLYITKAIIEEKFGGKIRARNIKEGLLFTMSLPLHVQKLPLQEF